MRTLLIGTVTALALVAGSAMAQSGGGGGAGGGGGEQNTTVPRAGQSTMSPGSAGTSGGNWSSGNPGGTTAGSGATGGYSAKGTAENPSGLSTSGNIDSRANPTAPGEGRTYDTLKQGGSGSTGTDRAVSGSSTTKPAQTKPSKSATESQRATGTHCPPGTPNCRPGNQAGQ